MFFLELNRLLDENEKKNAERIEYYKKELKKLSAEKEAIVPGEKVDALLETIKQRDAEIASLSAKLTEVEFQNKKLEKEELEIRNSTQFTKEVKKFRMGNFE